MVQVRIIASVHRRFLRVTRAAALIAFACLIPAVTSVRSASASAGTVSADYSVTSGDNTTLHIHNASATPWTNVVLSGVGSGGASGLSGTLNLGTIGAGSTVSLSFSGFCSSVFSADYDDCFRGEATYTLQGLSSGFGFSASFSPSHNASGGFVGFLGNDASGFESDVQVDDTIVANITVCGDGVVDPPEQCDDGNQANGDGCDANCTFPGCGNGIIDAGEECDAGTPSNGTCCTNSCTVAADGASCDDHLFCNGPDTCVGGACTVHSSDPCTGGAECDNICDEANHTCALPAGTACAEDGNPCTLDQCDGMGSCAHPAAFNFGPCDDGVFCNGADTCFQGACQFHDGDPCLFNVCAPTCDETAQACDPAAADTPCSDDGLPCTNDHCDGQGFCAHPPTAGGTPCPDDGNVCTNDECNGIGLCIHPARSDGTLCDDGNACTQTDRCASGHCVGSDPVICAAPSCYQPGTCDPSAGTCTDCPPGYSQGHGGCEKTYTIDASLLDDLPFSCGPSRYTCDSSFGFGFHWADTGDSSVGDVARIDIQLQPGYDCPALQHDVSLNDVPIGVYTSTSAATCSCFPDAAPQVVTNVDPAGYVKGGDNTVSIDTTECAGLSQDANGNYAVVTVTYADPGLAPALQTGCREAAKSHFGYKNNASDALDKLNWTWGKGAATAKTDFGDPTSSTSYELCIFRETGSKPALLFSGDVPPSATAWRAAGGTGLTYNDAAGSNGGIRSIGLRGGAAGKAKVALKGQGANLSDPALPLPLDTTGIRVQLTNESNGACWESEFPLSRITADDKRIKATVH